MLCIAGHSSEMAQRRGRELCSAGRKPKLSVRNGEIKTLDFLKQQHCTHKRKNGVPNTQSYMKNPKDSKEVSHPEGVLGTDKWAGNRSSFGLFPVVRGKAALTFSVLNLKTSCRRRGDDREHKPNGGADEQVCS